MTRPTLLAPPPLARAVGFLFFVLSAISLSFAIVIALALQIAPTSPMLFAIWCASLGIAAREVPRMWLKRARYVVTEQHVITYFGPFRRSIDRKAISFARIFWDDSDRNVRTTWRAAARATPRPWRASDLVRAPASAASGLFTAWTTRMGLGRRGCILVRGCREDG